MRLSKTTSVALAAAALLAAGVAPAAADAGDGTVACVANEICFARNTTDLRYQKHFYNAANHGSYSWFDSNTGHDSGIPMINDARRVKNRDGSCWVKVVDDRGILPDNYQWIPNDGVWLLLNSEVANKNDRHERC